jgi:hypothetical protein
MLESVGALFIRPHALTLSLSGSRLKENRPFGEAFPVNLETLILALLVALPPILLALAALIRALRADKRARAAHTRLDDVIPRRDPESRQHPK